MDRPPTPDDLQRVIETLEAFVDDRAELAHYPRELRVALLRAAGRLSRPDRHERSRVTKAFRRIEKKSRQSDDRAARAATEIRETRKMPVYAAPAQLVAGGEVAAPGEARELREPRNCYVCKAEYRR